VTDCKRLLCI